MIVLLTALLTVFDVRSSQHQLALSMLDNCSHWSSHVACITSVTYVRRLT